MLKYFVLSTDLKGLLENRGEYNSKNSLFGGANSVAEGGADMKTAQIMKELFELRGKSDKSDKPRSKIIDFSSLNEDKKKKIEEFNTMYDNTML